jgi:hypothetical protein
MSDQVMDGQYSDVNLGKCQVSSGSGTKFTGASSDGQGTNTECVFLGKLMYFYSSQSPAAADTVTKFRIYTLVDALEVDTGGGTSTIIGTLPNQYVSAIDPSVTGNAGVTPKLTRDFQIPQGLFVKNMCVLPISGGLAACAANTSNNFSIGIAQGLGSLDTNGSYKTGTQSASLIYATSLTTNDQNENTAVNNVVGNSVDYAKSAVICLTDGKRNAKLTIDLANSGFNVNTEVLGQGSGTPCP